MGAMRFRRLARSPEIRDAMIAIVSFALTLGLLGGAHGATRGLDPLGVALAAFTCFPLAARRRSPLGVFALTTASSAIMNAAGYALGPPFGPTVALFFVASDERTRSRIPRTAVVVLGMFAIHVGATTLSHQGFPTSPILFGIVVWGGAWILGDLIRQRRQRLADLADRARRSERDIQRERQLAAAEERTRIARDLHDSAAHAINVILVQAGAARLLQQQDPQAVRAALTTIEDVARETIGEIDHLIRGLRDDPGSAAAQQPVEPPPGLAAVEMLAERHRAAGLESEIRIEGLKRPLAPGLDQAAYRILQESLTNAARHGSGTAEVEISYGERHLELTVSNAVSAAPDGDLLERGHGLMGMRERAALLGGTLDAGMLGGRFRVHAHLPYGTAGPGA
jgi:signal transduction histidine kinase